jgi:hypothetical protein
MNGARVRSMVLSVRMEKVMAMTVPVTAMRPEIAPGGNGEPAAKGNEGQARDRVDDVAEAFRESNPRQPHDHGDEECREDVPDPSLKRGPRCFKFRPASLSSDQRNRQPVIRDDGVQNADRTDGDDQQQLLPMAHKLIRPQRATSTTALARITTLNLAKILSREISPALTDK